MNRKPGSVAALNALDLALESQRLATEQEAFILHLLPLLDNVERLCRGLEHSTPEAIALRKEALGLLAEIGDRAADDIGLERIGKCGEVARGEFYEVVDTKPCSDQPQGVVLDVVQFGWVFRGKVLRPAKVVAAVKP